jgi:glycosyltransferase involved in cell wall biosynthesis
VVIPSANRWPFVLRSVRCVLDQRDVPVEVLVCSDGPRNPTPPPAPELSDPRVRVFQDPEPRGVCRARNLGIAHARGEWIAFLDDDDVWAPDKLRRQLQAAEAAGADFAYTSGAVLDDALRVHRVEQAPPPEDLRRQALVENPLPAGASNVLARTALVRELGGFDERLMHFGDWDLELALIYAARGARCEEVLIGYVHHADAMHVRMLDGIEREFQLFADKHAADGLDVRSPVIARWIAGGYRSAGRRGRAVRTYLRSARDYRTPSDVVRAAGSLLGETAMQAARRRREEAAPPPPLAWVERIRAAEDRTTLAA